MAISYLPAIIDAYGDAYKINVITMEMCPPALTPVSALDGSALTRCDALHAHLPQLITATAPSYLLLAQADNTLSRASEQDLRAGYSALISQVQSDTTQVIILSAPPEIKPISGCATSMNTPTDCSAAPFAQQQTNTDLLSSASKAHPNTRFVNLDSLFQISGGVPPYAGSTVLYADGNHLTDAYAHRIAALLGLSHPDS